MEPTSFGQTLTTLRKAQAMTQRELAEKLSVSDKTISRWERGDGEPDMATIIALADLFGISCDQLLRGEAPVAAPVRPDPIPQLLIRYKNQTLLAMGVALLGLLAAALGNFLLENALLGFILGSSFCTASGITQWFIAGNALTAANQESAQSSRFRWLLVQYSMWTVGAILVVIGFCLPLILVPLLLQLEWADLYLVGTLGWVILGSILALMLLCLMPMGYQLLKRHLCPDFQPQKRQKTYNRTLIIGLILTLAFQLFGGRFLWHPAAIAQGQQFQDQNAFLELLRQDDSSSLNDQKEIGETQLRLLDGSTFVAFQGQSLRILRDSNGQEVLRFPQRNPTVAAVRYTPGDGTVSGLTAVTHSQLRSAKITSRNVNLTLLLLYPTEILAALVLYRRKA